MKVKVGELLLTDQCTELLERNIRYENFKINNNVVEFSPSRIVEKR